MLQPTSTASGSTQAIVITINDDSNSLTGASPEVLLREMAAMRPDVLGVNCTVDLALTVSDPAEIHVTPVCEEHANSEVIRFPNEEDN